MDFVIFPDLPHKWMELVKFWQKVQLPPTPDLTYSSSDLGTVNRRSRQREHTPPASFVRSLCGNIMPDIEEAHVYFTKSKVSATWLAKEDLSILQLAEKAGLKPLFGCRSAICGTCEVKLLKGQVKGPEGDFDKGIFICWSYPASEEIEIEL